MQDTGRNTARDAALRRFPTERAAVEALIARDGDFRDMCEELADAEQALKTAATMPPHLREARTVEWTELINRLIAEMTRALKDANVIRLVRADQKSRHN